MGVKSTTTLTREAAEKLYVDFAMRGVDLQRRFRAEAVMLSDRELEDKLEEMNDAYYREMNGHGFTGYDNYIISEYPYEFR